MLRKSAIVLSISFWEIISKDDTLSLARPVRPLVLFLKADSAGRTVSLP